MTRRPALEASTDPPPRVLVVGGTDPTGLAGVVRDVKTLQELGAFAAVAVTAVTVQTSRSVSDVVAMSASVVGAQIDAALHEIGVDAVKTGMLATVDIVHAVAQRIGQQGARCRLVVDPVLVASSGRALLSPDAVAALKDSLLPIAALVTPNLAEAEALVGFPVRTREEMSRAADALLTRGVGAVLIKGGHLLDYDSSLDELADLLRTVDGEELWLVRQRQRGPAFRGTGCTLASAVAAGIAEGLTLRGAVERARTALEKAMLNSTLATSGIRALGSLL